mgnify:CR=1 FL=1
MDRRVYEIDENYVSSNPRARPRKIKYIINSEGCWICISHTKSKHRGNYPVLKRYNRHMRMSRYIFELYNGYIDNKKYVMHTCDNPECINPKHLRLGTAWENTQDMIQKGRKPVGEEVPAAKLTEDEVVRIFNDSRGCTTIAKEYGVSKKTVLNIRHGKSWKHLNLKREDE